MIMAADLKFTGYRRPDGRFGVRNYVLVIPVDDLSNAACEAVAHNIRGTMALPHPYGRLQFGKDLDLTFRTIAGQGRNPNCAAAVVIGIEPNWTNRVVKEIEKTGKPCAAAGSVVHFFPTGQGNVIGNPVIPVIKLSANPLTCTTMSEHIDVDLKAMLRMEMNLDQAGDALLKMLERTINGRLTAAEALRHNEFVLTKLYRSA